jgi:phosphatidylserine/phosphatidylglycerophosphate/cardiolipin synthase-like enzyme
MPWHDIAIQVKGAVVIDLQRHFVQYWYFSIRDLSDDPKDYLNNFRNRYNELMRLEKEKRSVPIADSQAHK